MSDSEVVFLHNPRCSKSRQLKTLLDERGTSYTERLYLDDPLDRAELEELGRQLGSPVASFVRSGEAQFQELGLSKDAGDAALLDALVAHPILMQRPVLIANGKAAIGRPPESALDVLD